LKKILQRSKIGTLYMSTNNEFCRMPIWYPDFAAFAFLTSFVRLNDDEIVALAEGIDSGPRVKDVIKRMKQPMSSIPGNCFVSVDQVAPTDTERFKGKRGAVHSARSAWKYLALSEKVRQSARDGKVSYICFRPFRRMNQTREFRLFIHKRELKAMSQYWLIRHFRRLDRVQQKYWKMAQQFTEQIAWLLPTENIVVDIYFTSDNEILLIDFNEWGECNPLMARSWERDWDEEIGSLMMPPPTKISGNVNMSF
jgi:D123